MPTHYKHDSIRRVIAVGSADENYAQMCLNTLDVGASSAVKFPQTNMVQYRYGQLASPADDFQWVSPVVIIHAAVQATILLTPSATAFSCPHVSASQDMAVADRILASQMHFCRPPGCKTNGGNPALRSSSSTDKQDAST